MSEPERWNEQGIYLPSAVRDPARALARAVVAISIVAVLVMAPLATMPLAAVPAFIPAYQLALVITDVITVVFLLGQHPISRTNALGLLAGGYLFTALMSVVHALTFPGLFTPSGLLGAGPQTTAWLYIFWHSGFPLFVIAYAICSASPPPSWANRSGLVASFGLVFVLAGGLTLLATWGQAPPSCGDAGQPLHADRRHRGVERMALNLMALLALARRTALFGPRSLADGDRVRMAVRHRAQRRVQRRALRSRFLCRAGFTACSRRASFSSCCWRNTASFMFSSSDCGTATVDKTEELRRLSTVDPLTGIANRRAFEEALDQEWRRMMRHHTRSRCC